MQKYIDGRLYTKSKVILDILHAHLSTYESKSGQKAAKKLQSMPHSFTVTSKFEARACYNAVAKGKKMLGLSGFHSVPDDRLDEQGWVRHRLKADLLNVDRFLDALITYRENSCEIKRKYQRKNKAWL